MTVEVSLGTLRVPAQRVGLGFADELGDLVAVLGEEGLEGVDG